MKKYTMNDFKEMFDKAKMEVLTNPTKGLKGEESEKAEAKVSLMLSGMLLFQQLEKELFGDEEDA